MRATAKDELIDALCEVSDLDGLHALLSNDTTDRLSSPQFSAWLVELVNAERNARDSEETTTEYPMHDFSVWPPAYLYQATALTLCIVEAALAIGEPTIQQFAIRLHAVMVGSMGLQMLEAVCELEKRNATAS